MKSGKMIVSVLLLAGITAWGKADSSARMQKPVWDLWGLASLYEKYQQNFLPLLIPRGIYLHAHRNVVPANFDRFPFLKAHMDTRTGHILRTVYVFEDAKSREIVFLDADSFEVGRIPRPSSYWPYS